jgi:hypothetical protein
MAPSNSNNVSADGTQIPGLKSETFAATIDHRNMLEEFGRKYHALGVEAGHSKGIEAGHAMGVEAGLAQAEGEIELRIASAVEESQEIISELLEKRTKEVEVDADLANEARELFLSPSLKSNIDDEFRRDYLFGCILRGRPHPFTWNSHGYLQCDQREVRVS